jgi:hypothetical protein
MVFSGIAKTPDLRGTLPGIIFRFILCQNQTKLHSSSKMLVFTFLVPALINFVVRRSWGLAWCVTWLRSRCIRSRE